MKKLLLLLIILGSGLSAYGQQFPVYNQYIVAPYLYNPAVAGQKDYTQVFGLYRRQWTNITGSPETQALLIDGPLSETVGVGLSVFNDEENIISKTSVLGTFSYGFQLADDQRLSFGLSLGILQNRIDFDAVQSDQKQLDLLLLQNAESRTAFNGNFGVHYNWRALRVGFAAHNLFGNEINYENEAENQEVTYNLLRHYYITAGYKFMLSPKFALQPNVLLRSVEGSQSQLELNATAYYMDDYWLGITYRNDANFAATIGLYVYDRLTIGYSYEMNTGDFGMNSGSTHEAIIGYRFGRKKADTKETASSSSDFSSDKYDRMNQEQYEMIEQLSQQNQKLTQEVAGLQETVEREEAEIQAIEKEIEEEKAIIEEQQSEIEELRRIIEEQHHQVKPIVDSIAVDLTIEEFETPTRYLYFVVVGAFSELIHAKRFQQMLRRQAGLQTHVLLLKEKPLHIVYTKQANEKADLENELKKLDNTNYKRWISGNPWIYKLTLK